MKRRRTLVGGLTVGGLVVASALAWTGPAAVAADGDVAVGADGTVQIDTGYDGPQVTEVRVINEARYLEIYWDRYVDENAAVSPGNITLRNGDRTIALKAKPAQGGTDTIFFDKDNKQIAATAANSMARLPEDLHLSSIAYTGTIDPSLPLTLEINGAAIADAGGNAAKTATYTGVPRLDYYTQSLMTGAGVEVKAGERVAAATLTKAAAQVDAQLARSGTGIAATMAANGCSLAVYGSRENAYLVPEHRGGYNPTMYDVEGYGGNMWNSCVSSISERNVLRTRGDANTFLNTAYPNENILVHEFGHAVLSVGIEEQADQALSDAFFAAYENAYTTGRWPNTYAMSNRDEFFATLSAIWFDNMAEKPDWNDGVRSPINTRAELKEYDPVSYAFFASIYPDDVAMPSPWDVPGPDIHHGDFRQEPAQPARVDATDVDYGADIFRIVTASLGSEYQIDRYAGDPDHPSRDMVIWFRWGGGVWKVAYEGGGFVISASDGSGVLTAVSDSEVAYLGIARDAADPRQTWTFAADASTTANAYDGHLVNRANDRALVLDGRAGSGVSMTLTDAGAGTRWMLEDTNRTTAQGTSAYVVPVKVSLTSGGQSEIVDAPAQGFTLPSITDVAGKDWSRTGERFAGWAPAGSTEPLPEGWTIPAGTTSVDLVALWVPDTEAPSTVLVSPATAGPLSGLSIQVDATDDVGLAKIVADVYRGGKLVKSTRTDADGAIAESHTATVAGLADGDYTLRYYAADEAGNVSAKTSFAFTVDGAAPIVKVKKGAAFTTGGNGTYTTVSFQIRDNDRVASVALNGVVQQSAGKKSDLDRVRAGEVGAQFGENLLVVTDVAGNTTEVTFTLEK
ncbi:hypothetical protein J2X85_000525 [Microbacterium trichothecenolyticum]|uniref:hypothetical protein n=1 Tax=Microbacterium trichothecenolyticum TaxID=69370 RepID=UPI0028565D15|nr:hypothetical protein [Microbacterium trichothecenolyticum]MDR7183502.1 hypothetical protein [Microbacterium trichothecenolyticum]